MAFNNEPADMLIAFDDLPEARFEHSCLVGEAAPRVVVRTVDQQPRRQACLSQAVGCALQGCRIVIGRIFAAP